MRLVQPDWKFTGGYGGGLTWESKNKDYAYIYRYIGLKPQPVKARWKMECKKGKKKVTEFFRTQHEALTKAVSYLY